MRRLCDDRECYSANSVVLNTERSYQLGVWQHLNTAHTLVFRGETSARHMAATPSNVTISVSRVGVSVVVMVILLDRMGARNMS